MKILFVSPPFSGHLNRLVPLAETARGAGHDCVFLTGRAKAAGLESRGLRVLVPKSIPHDAMERIADWPQQAGKRAFELISQFRANLQILAPLSAEVRDILRDQKPDVVVADFVAAVVAQWCEAEHIPWITTIGTPFAIESRRGVPSYVG
ncbi:MAG TPA: hypothetical protein VGI22_01765, partial [Xanthobacteraceae bacterium]